MKILVFILFLITCTSLSAQNLISNPSFEDIDSCYGQPAGIGFDVFEWSGCTGWSCPIASSSDLWCPFSMGGSEPPNTNVVYQYPRTGTNFAGLLENGGVILNYREYLQNELLVDLEANKWYILEFYYSSLHPDCSINTFQIILENEKMANNSQLWLTEMQPDASSDPNLYSNDTLGWNYGKIIFQAKGGEKFLIFGNFQDTTKATYANPCDTSFWGDISYAGNYFVFDDFSLNELPIVIFIPNVFTPNNDGINDFFEPNITNLDNWEIVILNRWGNEIITLDESTPNWNGEEYSEGIFFYKFYSELEGLKQGFFQLIR